MAKCWHCQSDLSRKGSVSYLSGDRKEGHYEERIEGVDTRITVFVYDEEGECDSEYSCAACGAHLDSPDKNEVWD